MCEFMNGYDHGAGVELCDTTGVKMVPCCSVNELQLLNFGSYLCSESLTKPELLTAQLESQTLVG